MTLSNKYTKINNFKDILSDLIVSQVPIYLTFLFFLLLSIKRHLTKYLLIIYKPLGNNKKFNNRQLAKNNLAILKMSKYQSL